MFRKREKLIKTNPQCFKTKVFFFFFLHEQVGYIKKILHKLYLQ
jgi:hypothetical protein